MLLRLCDVVWRLAIYCAMHHSRAEAKTVVPAVTTKRAVQRKVSKSDQMEGGGRKCRANGVWKVLKWNFQIESEDERLWGVRIRLMLFSKVHFKWKINIFDGKGKTAFFFKKIVKKIDVVCCEHFKKFFRRPESKNFFEFGYLSFERSKNHGRKHFTKLKLSKL